MSHGPSSVIVSALENTWAEMRDKHEDIPQVVFVTGKGTKGAEIKWGHWCPDRWSVRYLGQGEEDLADTLDGIKSGRLASHMPEVFISGECLAQGPLKVLTTLLHEAAHGVAHVRKIKDTSRGNRYHNQKFVAVAEELGLVGPEVPHTVRGWSSCTLGESTAATYESLPALEEAIVVCIGGRLEIGPEADEPAKRNPQPKYGCGCEDRFIRMSMKVYESAPILCGLCEEPFLEVVA